MKWTRLFHAVVCLSSVLGIAQSPHAEIHSGTMTASIYVPDVQRGFYRGTRFDWGGVIYDLEVAGHHVYRPWFSSVDLAVSDFTYEGNAIVAGPNSAMAGPAEEFQKPLGYDSAKPGQTFLKVGVGLLRKADDKPYSFRTHFELMDGGVWKTTRTADTITFVQTYGSPASDYAYVYTKRIRLNGRENQLILQHSLRNTGKLPIQTIVYDHNFFTLDGGTIGAGYRVTVPYQIKPDRLPDADFIRINGNEADYIRDLEGKDLVSFKLHTESDPAEKYDIQLLDQSKNFEVHITGDRPVIQTMVWSIRSVLAIEPFLTVDAEPGNEFTWSYSYTYTDKSKAR